MSQLAKTPTTLKSVLSGDAIRQQVSAALPKHLPPDRFLRVAMTALSRIPRLAECEQVSFFRCLLDLSAMGLEPDGRKAHLIPFRNNKNNTTECQLIVDYKGLLELVRRSGETESLHCDIVCENDSFKRGIKDGKTFLEWEPANQDRGEVIGAFSVVVMKGGALEWEYMTKEDIEGVRKRSKASGSGPWVSDWAEMARKTVFRRHSKRLPFSPEIRQHIEADDTHQFDMRPGSIDVDAQAETVERKPAIPTPVATPPDSAVDTAPEPTPFERVETELQRLGWTIQQAEALASAEGLAEDDEKFALYTNDQLTGLLEALEATK